MGCVCVLCQTWPRARDGGGRPHGKKDEQEGGDPQEKLRALRDREWEVDVMIWAWGMERPTRTGDGELPGQF